MRLLLRRTGSGFGANMYAEEDDERTRNSITSTRGAIELRAHKTIVLRKQTRTISFDRVNHSIL